MSNFLSGSPRSLETEGSLSMLNMHSYLADSHRQLPKKTDPIQGIFKDCNDKANGDKASDVLQSYTDVTFLLGVITPRFARHTYSYLNRNT